MENFAVVWLALLVLALFSYSIAPKFLATKPTEVVQRFISTTPPMVPLALSALVLLSALWIILSARYEDATEKWAFGAVGSVIGHWFSKKD